MLFHCASKRSEISLEHHHMLSIYRINGQGQQIINFSQLQGRYLILIDLTQSCAGKNAERSTSNLIPITSNHLASFSKR
jgi:hypothetical protein